MQYGYPALWGKYTDHERTHDSIVTSSDANRIIKAIQSEVSDKHGGRWPWQYWTKQSICAEALFRHNNSIRNAKTYLTPSLSKVKALTFTHNENNMRVAISDPREQRKALDRQLRAMISSVKQVLDEIEPKDEKIPDPPEEKPEEKKPEIHPWLAFIYKAREFFAARKADGHEMDEWGMRQAEYGAHMLKAGIPLEALMHAATMHLPAEARRTLMVKDYDVSKFHKQEREQGKHMALPYIMALVKAGIPTALIGSKGCGKSTVCKQVAEKIFGDDPSKFTLISMTSATSPSAFFGRPKIGGDGGVVESQFSKIMREGGLVLLDEMDAADENLLLITNSAIANRRFYNQNTAELIDVHDTTIFMAAMNTLGLGAGRDYTSRNRLDAATLDRWSMGRVRLTHDTALEEDIFFDILNS
jgi:hypothetical protein